MGVVGTLRMTSWPVSSIFLFSTALLDLAISRPVHSLMFSHTSFSVYLVFFPLSLCLARWFWPNWWTEDVSIPLQFASHYNSQEVFMQSNCLLNLGTDFLIGNLSLYEMSSKLVPCSNSSFSQLAFFFALCCEGPWVTSIQEDWCDKFS